MLSGFEWLYKLPADQIAFYSGLIVGCCFTLSFMLVAKLLFFEGRG